MSMRGASAGGVPEHRPRGCEHGLVHGVADMEREKDGKTIRNLTDIGSKGMSETDRMIQHILECK